MTPPGFRRVSPAPMAAKEESARVMICGSPPGRPAEVEHHTVHRLRLGIPVHMRVAVQMDFRLQPLGLQQCPGLFHRLRLNVKGQDPPLRPCQAAQQSGVPPLARRGVNAEGTGLDGPAQKFMDHTQGIVLHLLFSFPALRAVTKRPGNSPGAFG